MIERVKAWADAVGSFLIYVLTPLAFIAGWIWYLFQKQHTLEDKISELTQDGRQKELEGKVKEDEKDVQQSTGDYTKLRYQYLAEHGPGGDVPGSDPGGGQGNPGSGKDDSGS